MSALGNMKLRSGTAPQCCARCLTMQSAPASISPRLSTPLLVMPGSQSTTQAKMSHSSRPRPFRTPQQDPCMQASRQVQTEASGTPPEWPNSSTGAQDQPSASTSQHTGNDSSLQGQLANATEGGITATMSTTNSNSSSSVSGSSSKVEDDSLPVRIALSMLGFYRSGISPLMPKNCRFQPTCSEYSIASYKKYGVWKGTVLTAWRLLRCNPWGSSGYDPTSWPPKGLELVYNDEKLAYAPQVSVVLGSLAFAWFVHGLLDGLLW